MRRWVFAAALLLAQPVVGAQDVLDADEWNAILKATAPQVEADQQARAAVEEKPRSKRARAREKAEIEKAAASVESLKTAASADPPSATAEPEKPEKAEKPGKRGKRGTREKTAAAGSEKVAGASGKAAASEDGKGSKSEEAGKSGKSAANEETGKASKSSAREQNKEESGKGGTRAGKTAAAEKPAPLKRDKGDRGVPANYVALKRYWHAPWSEDSRSRMAGLAPPLIIHPVHPLGGNPTPYVLLPESSDGGFNEAQLAVASQAWDSWEGGPRVSERLLNLIYHAAIHFDMFHVHLISGVRHDRGGSRHSHGLAGDIVLPGVSDEDLATYFRAQGFCGVGIYTRAGFVHIDSRDQSYFWLDWSLPGKRNRQQQIRGEEAKAADEAAVARGQNAFINPPKLQRALEVRLRKRKGKGRTAAAQPTVQQGS